MYCTMNVSRSGLDVESRHKSDELERPMDLQHDEEDDLSFLQQQQQHSESDRFVLAAQARFRIVASATVTANDRQTMQVDRYLMQGYRCPDAVV